MEKFFRRHHYTLESIVINLKAIETPHECLKTLAALGAPCLESFVFQNGQRATHAGEETLGTTIATLMKSTPALHMVRLDSVDLEG